MRAGGRVALLDEYGAGDAPRTAFSSWLRDLRALMDQVRKEGLPAILAWGASIALGLALVVWVGSRAGRLHKPLVPRFTRRIPAVAQGGVAGHAAVIAAPQTT